MYSRSFMWNYYNNSHHISNNYPWVYILFQLLRCIYVILHNKFPVSCDHINTDKKSYIAIKYNLQISVGLHNKNFAFNPFKIWGCLV